ncbi:BT0820 family HAD-type phosphatase [Sinomicrobium oceani]|uniref:BT0820 family HAD-type phosphatase n=1 Tax=Sinomicrobium oceani TaxID=1150368 RepID=UPI00227B55B1|nr:hydrolase [Sinomicrobium oceani]
MNPNFIRSNSKVIAVDFDGTIVTHRYPEIGKPVPGALAIIMALQRKGHRLILWTYREGRYLEEAVAYCRTHGIEFYAVNENYPGEAQQGNYPRKLNADIFIDDRNAGGLMGWKEIWQWLYPEEDRSYATHQKASVLSVLKRLLFPTRKK